MTKAMDVEKSWQDPLIPWRKEAFHEMLKRVNLKTTGGFYG
jgi:hypothetical protein